MVRWWFFSADEHTRNVFPFRFRFCTYCANICHIMIFCDVVVVVAGWLCFFCHRRRFVKLFRFLRHGFVITCSLIHSTLILQLLWKRALFLWFSFENFHSNRLSDRLHLHNYFSLIQYVVRAFSSNPHAWTYIYQFRILCGSALNSFGYKITVRFWYYLKITLPNTQMPVEWGGKKTTNK